MPKYSLVLSVFLLSVLMLGCSTQQPSIEVQYIYKEKIKYVYLPCQQSSQDKGISVKKKKIQKQALAEEKKYYEPKFMKLYAPKKYTQRSHKKMDFMLGINEDGSEFIYLEGEFGLNTYKNFLTFMNQTNTSTKEIKISSNGGLVATAMQLGAYIYDNKWNTGVDKEMHCFSACGFVYFAGKDKSLEGQAKVGLHRPYVPGEQDTQASIRKIKSEYISYWNYIHASKSVYDEMMEIDRNNLFILDRNNINDYIDVKIK